MDKVIIEDLLLRGIIGVSERERSQPQDILVNIVFMTDTSLAAKSDDVNDSVNYRTVAKSIIAHNEKVSRFTVEALAADIAEICLSFPLVEEVTVKVGKARCSPLFQISWSGNSQKTKCQLIMMRFC